MWKLTMLYIIIIILFTIHSIHFGQSALGYMDFGLAAGHITNFRFSNGSQVLSHFSEDVVQDLHENVAF